MRFFILDDPARPGHFARFSHVGTWLDGRICDVCGVSSSRLAEPLQIEWDPGTSRIGDFSWCGYAGVVVDDVRIFLARNAFECGFGRVEVVQPAERTRKPRVPFPYEGPKLSWLMPLVKIALDGTASNLQLLSDCAHCGQRRYTFKSDRLVINKSSWSGEKIFLVEQFERSGAMFIPEPTLDMFTDAKFTNLYPRLAGEIV